MFAQRRAPPFDSRNLPSIHSCASLPSWKKAEIVVPAQPIQRSSSTAESAAAPPLMLLTLLAAGVAVLSHQALENRW
ncbi:hypothetical protein [Nocardia araoensis]|uniref:hypothetical protein n=1 Tax=Nocardia araoensis TaxID=228600 RepID=UPI00030DDEE9|nr:hypothetical protein [Nocardia araoensis]